MTRAVRDRILKDANGNIGDHLRSHIHLTNCIHLKNHMHKQSPGFADRSLMRDLVALQRSRSLRDPSMSPPSWQSPSVVDVLLRRGERDSGNGNRRRSVGIDFTMDDRGMSGSSLIVAPAGDEVVVVSERSSKSGARERRRVKREVSHGGDHELPGVGDGSFRDNYSGNSEQKDRDNQSKGRLRQGDHLRTLSEQLQELPFESDDAASSHNHVHGIHAQNHGFAGEAEANVRGQRGSLNRGRRRKCQAARRTRASVPGGQNEMSVASNSLAQGGGHRKYHTEEGNEEYPNQNVTRGPTNGCGIPWNWSRIHHRGKSFLDIAGRSLSCGLSDPRLRKGGLSDIPVISDYSNSSSKSGAEALPLLVDASESQRSIDNAAWVHDYSGELGIFADNLLNHEADSELMSEGRSGEQQNRRNRRIRHQSITQKYMPRTFRDLVGQHLVAQALSNAVVRRKVGLLYVFYGPHGTGKTSTARIFSRALNCQSQEHPKPCGVCNSCVSYNRKKSRNIREIGPMSNFDFEGIMDLLEHMIVSHMPSQYRVLILDDCDTLSPDSWAAIVKVIDGAPRRVVFILVCSTLDVLPHIIISRCQKFFFPKLKDADIIYALQWIATNEDLEIDKDALKLIASKSDGSLRDAEMTLEQLSLLGQRISVPLVQEMVGLISDEKLVDLLDFALSADTVNTVKNLREIMESGVEPLALMSQLATVITDILAGGYDFTKKGHRRKFFRRQALSKEDMEKLRQALKTLSEAEKQLRMSNDRLTWLTAALLQLAPDQQFMLPSSSADTSFNHSPLRLNQADAKQKPRKSNVDHSHMPNSEKALSAKVRIDSRAEASGDANFNAKMNSNCIDRPLHAKSISSDRNRLSNRQLRVKYHGEIEEIWLDVLEQIQVNSIKEFLNREGKLISVSYGAAPTVQLVFTSHLNKSTAERFKAHILPAFESVLGSPLTIEIRCESSNNVRQKPFALPVSQNGFRENRSEIVEIEASPRERRGNETIEDTTQYDMQNMISSSMVSFPDQRKPSEYNRSLSLVKSKVSLGHVIQQAEGCTQLSGWSKQKAVSIAEKLEQENLRLEPKSRSLLCWNASKISRRKLLRWKIRTKKPQRLLRFVTCGRCLSGRSPR